MAEVPFVDVVTTMSDTRLATHGDRVGGVGRPGARSRTPTGGCSKYSPYDNVTERNGDGATYPALFVTAGLNDPRVGYSEPAKWVAKLRSAGAGGPDRRRFCSAPNWAPGHQGSTGRYDAWRDEARIQAFILTEVGLAPVTGAGRA